MTLFVSIFAYAWTKNGGTLARELEAGEKSTTPAFRTLHRLRKSHETLLHLEGSTLIARARCRAAGAFLQSELPLWLTLDEDVEATEEALEGLLDCARDGALSFAAMRLRSDARRLNVEPVELPHLSNVPTLYSTPSRSFPVRRAGVALAVLPRQLVEEVAFRSCAFFHEDVAPHGRIKCPALFLERVEAGEWIGEDVAFCDRAFACRVGMTGFVHAGVTHAGLSNAEVML